MYTVTRIGLARTRSAIILQQQQRRGMGETAKASLDQLTKVADTLTLYLPRFFSTPHPFYIYTRDVVFQDNVKSRRIQGLPSYALQVSLVKVYYSLNYTANKLEMLNLVKNPEESHVKIRWRVVSKPGLTRFLLMPSKFHTDQVWTDRISSFYVNAEGKVYCHICDNIDVEDSTNKKVKNEVKNPLVSREVSV